MTLIKNKKISQADIQLLEREYVQSNVSYASLAARHSLPLSFVQRCGRLGSWKQKRKNYRTSKADKSTDTAVDCTDEKLTALLKSFGLTELYSASLQLDGIVRRAVGYADDAFDGVADTKSLKELAATVKEAVTLKRNLLLTPVLTEQRLLELDKRRNAGTEEAQVIRVVFDDISEDFGV